MGRKKIRLDAAAVERLAAEGLSESQIARQLGVCADTLTARKRDTSDISDAIKKGRRAAVGTIENVAFSCARKALEDPRYQTSLIFWLKTQAGWKERQVIETVETDADGERREDIMRRLLKELAVVEAEEGAEAAADVADQPV